MSETEAGGEGKGGSAKNGSPEDKNGKPAKPPNRLPLIILGVFVVVALIAGLYYYFSTKGLESTDDAQVDGDAVTIAPKVSGYVVTLNITDNQLVKAGQLLLEIDPRDYRASRDQAAASLDLARAQLANAQANLDTTLVTGPARLTQAEAQRDSASATLANAELEAKRQNSIDKRATTQENIDNATTQTRTAAATLAYNKAQVEIAKLIPETVASARAQVDQFKAQVESATAQLATAELNLSYTQMRAPQDGWVTMRNVDLGSYVTPGQSLFSLVTTHPWVTANFKETQLNRMRRGQHVAITVDAYSGIKLDGHVESIQMGTGSRFSAFPAENATGNYVKIVQRVPVKIVIDSGLDPNLPLPLGLSVDPTVDER